MANKKISELQSRTPALSDLMLVGDPSSGYSYKCTVTALATIIETDIADGYVTIGTTQTISGAKTFSNNLTLTSVANATTTQTKFLTLNASNVVNYRTGAEVLADIGGQGTISLAAIGSTPNANGATLSSNTLTLQPASASFGGVLTTGFQEIAGWKRFTGNPIQFDNHLEIKNLNSWGVSWGYTSFASKDTPVFGFLRGHNSTGSVTYNAWFTYGTTGDRNYTLPSSDGTLALTSQIPTVSGTTNYVAKFTSSSAIGNSQIFDNGTSVGINTATPNEKLEVSGVVRVSRTTSPSAYLNLTIESGVAGFDARGSIDQVFYTGAVERMRIGFGGDVTISTIANATTDTDKFLVSDSGVIKYRTGAEVLSDIGAASSSSISGTTNYIPKFTSSSAIGNSVIYDNSGDIGIGFTSTFGKLSINVNAAAPASSGNMTNGLTVANTNGGRAINLGINESGAYSYIQSAYVNNADVAVNLAFFTGASERMRLDASGNLGIGTSSPTSKLDVQGAISLGAVALPSAGVARLYSRNTDNNLYIQTSTGNNFYLLDGSQNSMYTVSPTSHLWLINNSTRMTLDASGNLGLGVTPSAWGYSGNMELIGSGRYFTSKSDDNRFASNVYNDGTNEDYASNGFATRYRQANGIHSWSTAPSGTAGNAISFTQAMTLFSTGNLAVGGTSDNGSRLQVTGTSSFTGRMTAVEIGVTRNGANTIGDGPWYRWTNAAENRQMLTQLNASNGLTTWAYDGTSWTERFTLTNAGNVGIGTTSPASTLSVYSTAATNVLQLVEQGTSGRGSQIQIKNAHNTGYYLGLSGDTNGDVIQYNGGNTNMIFYTNALERMRITSGGNVGIGSTTPLNGVSGGGLQITNSTAAYVRVNATGFTGLDLIQGTDGTGYLFQRDNNDIRFGTNNAERMRITSGGDVLVGRTSGGLNNTSGLTLQGNGAYQAEQDGYVFYGNRTNSDGLFMGIRRNNVDVGSITVTTSSTAFNTSSDYRLKQDLKTFNGLSLIDNINVYDYQWKSDRTRSYGVLAHELQSVIPYAVTGEKDGQLIQGVDYSKLVPVLVQAIKDLKAEIEIIKNK